MNKTKITIVDSLAYYDKCLLGQADDNDFRYDLMKPLTQMWHYLNAPLVAKTSGGYDVVMAAEMLGIWTPSQANPLLTTQLRDLKETSIFTEAEAILTTAIQRFQQIGYDLPLSEITLAILLGDSENKLLAANESYSGFGGIPGYIMLIVVPNDFNSPRLKSALAHELNHNVRFTYEPFNYGDVSVEDYLVIEGLAEVFAESLYGALYRGPWVQDYDDEEMAYTIEIMKDGRSARGFDQVSAYMYGDEVAKAQGFQPVGLAKNAGYTIGYYLVKAYLQQTGETIEQATLTPTAHIIEKSKFFL